MSTEVLLKEFAEVSEHPYRVLSAYKKEGKKVIGVLPYFAPTELVVAAGMVPMGIWGSNSKTIAMAKEYCATFYCTMAQLALEMLLDGTLDQLDGVITPTICDTLRPMSQMCIRDSAQAGHRHHPRAEGQPRRHLHHRGRRVP